MYVWFWTVKLYFNSSQRLRLNQNLERIGCAVKLNYGTCAAFSNFDSTLKGKIAKDDPSFFGLEMELLYKNATGHVPPA